MTPLEILAAIGGAGVSIRSNGGQLILSPKAALTAELLDLVKANKAALLAALEPVAHVALVALPGGCGGEEDFSESDLQAMDYLLHQLALLGEWPQEELETLLDERRRMAPRNVRKGLAALRIARDEALAVWPNKPRTHTPITLCELTSRRTELSMLMGDAVATGELNNSGRRERAA